MMKRQQLLINQINRKEKKPEVYVHAHVPKNLRKTKSSNKPQLYVEGLQATKGLTWFRQGDIIVNHVWPYVDRRKRVKVDARPTRTPRPTTAAPKHKQAEEYRVDNAMKKIQSVFHKQQEWERQIEQQQNADDQQPNDVGPGPAQA